MAKIASRTLTYEQALQRLNSSPLPGWMEKSVPGISEERDALQAGRKGEALVYHKKDKNHCQIEQESFF